MRVLEIISDTNIGGAGRLLLTRLSHSDRFRFETAVAMPQGSRLAPLFSNLGIAVYPLQGCQDISLDWRAIAELCRLLRDLRPDLVHAHGTLSARIAATLCHVPVRIHTRHCTYPVGGAWKIPPVRALGGKVQGMLSDGVIAVAHAAAEDLRHLGVREEKIRVIINGVDAIAMPNPLIKAMARKTLGLPPDAFVVGLVARLEKCKGHEDLLRAARILCRQDDCFHFLIVGDGSRMAELKSLARALDIDDHVHFTGFLSDVSESFYCMDIHVNCSCGTETSSLALSEGMSIGLPCVASDYGGNPYMVRHGENGYIYPVGDFVQLSRQIYLLSQDADLYARMSRAAYQRFCEELTAERMTRLTEAYYEELWENRKSRRCF